MARTKNLRSERAQSRARRRLYTQLGIGGIFLAILLTVVFLVVRNADDNSPELTPTVPAAAGEPPVDAPENVVSSSPTSAYDLSAIKSIALGRGPFFTTASGLEYQEVSVGTGNLTAPGDFIGVQYKGWLLDGTRFDDSGEQAFQFALGQGKVIPGWDEGLVGMQLGGRRILVIPPELAYGSLGIEGVIPADSVLVFDVYLVSLTQPR